MKTNTVLKCGGVCAVLITCVGYFFYLNSKQRDLPDIQPAEERTLSVQDPAGSLLVNETPTVEASQNTTSNIVEHRENEKSIDSASNQTFETRMREQMELASSAFEIDLQSGIFKGGEMKDRILGKRMRVLELSDGKKLKFDAVTGQLLCYLSFVQEEIPSGLTKQDAISRDKALAIAQQTLNKLGVGAGFEFEKAYYGKGPSAAGSDDPDSLIGGEWSFHGSQKYEGIPYFSSGIHIRVSAYSGIILAYVNDPMGPLPVSLEERITADEASSIASDFLGIGFWGLLNGVHVRPATKVIACSNTYFSSPGKRPIVQGTESHLCWQVIVENYNDFPLTIIVNAATGEIIGGI